MFGRKQSRVAWGRSSVCYYGPDAGHGGGPGQGGMGSQRGGIGNTGGGNSNSNGGGGNRNGGKKRGRSGRDNYSPSQAQVDRARAANRGQVVGSTSGIGGRGGWMGSGFRTASDWASANFTNDPTGQFSQGQTAAFRNQAFLNIASIAALGVPGLGQAMMIGGLAKGVHDWATGKPTTGGGGRRSRGAVGTVLSVGAKATQVASKFAPGFAPVSRALGLASGVVDAATAETTEGKVAAGVNLAARTVAPGLAPAVAPTAMAASAARLDRSQRATNASIARESAMERGFAEQTRTGQTQPAPPAPDVITTPVNQRGAVSAPTVVSPSPRAARRTAASRVRSEPVALNYEPMVIQGEMELGLPAPQRVASGRPATPQPANEFMGSPVNMPEAPPTLADAEAAIAPISARVEAGVRSMEVARERGRMIDAGLLAVAPGVGKVGVMAVKSGAKAAAKGIVDAGVGVGLLTAGKQVVSPGATSRLSQYTAMLSRNPTTTEKAITVGKEFASKVVGTRGALPSGVRGVREAGRVTGVVVRGAPVVAGVGANVAVSPPAISDPVVDQYGNISNRTAVRGSSYYGGATSPQATRGNISPGVVQGASASPSRAASLQAPDVSMQANVGGETPGGGQVVPGLHVANTGYPSQLANQQPFSMSSRIRGSLPPGVVSRAPVAATNNQGQPVDAQGRPIIYPLPVARAPGAPAAPTMPTVPFKFVRPQLLLAQRRRARPHGDQLNPFPVVV